MKRALMFAWMALPLAGWGDGWLMAWAEARDKDAASTALIDMASAARNGDPAAALGCVVLNEHGHRIPWTSIEASTHPGKAREYAAATLKAVPDSFITGVLGIDRTGFRCTTASSIVHVDWSALKDSEDPNVVALA